MRMSNAGTAGQIVVDDAATRSMTLPLVRGAAAPEDSTSPIVNRPGRCIGPTSMRTGHTGLPCRTMLVTYVSLPSTSTSTLATPSVRQ